MGLIDTTQLEAELGAVRRIAQSAQDSASELASKVEVLDGKLKAIEDGNTAGGSPGTGGGSGGGEQPPVNTERSGIIGVNSGFTLRDNNTHPDRPETPGYDGLFYPVGACFRPMNANRINDFMKIVANIADPHYYGEYTWREVLTKQAELCKRNNSHFYFNAPFSATVEFVYQAVALIRSILPVHLKIYVSWSNENWNGPRSPYQQIKSIVGMDMGAGPNLVFFDYWARCLSDTFKAARGADPDCIRVVETKTADDGKWITNRVVERLKTAYDALAITTYWSPKQSDYFDGITEDQIFDAAWNNWNAKEKPYQAQLIAWAVAKGKQVISYEGGPHFVDYSYRPHVVDVLRRCQSNPRMVQQYKAVLDHAFGAGLSLHNHFEFVGWWDKNGFWGLADSVANLSASPKYQFLKGYVRP